MTLNEYLMSLNDPVMTPTRCREQMRSRAEHMAQMRKKLRAGHSFARAHRAAKRAVGK